MALFQLRHCLFGAVGPQTLGCARRAIVVMYVATMAYLISTRLWAATHYCRYAIP